MVGSVNLNGLIWLYIGLGGLTFRTVHLFFLRDVNTGLVWALKIMTDPFPDIMLYWRCIFHLLKSLRRDHGSHVRFPRLRDSPSHNQAQPDVRNIQ